MSDQRYTASLSLGGQNRTVWSVIFRHPLPLRGKVGRRVRRSLGTPDKVLAQGMVDQANILLADKKWWVPSMRDQALRLFAQEVVAAFYDDLLPSPRDGWQMREDDIKLPTPAEGYARVLLLGTTGAGKTTLVRQLIGTGDRYEKFPSISPAKTTTCDIEIVMSDQDSYEAVVSFLPKEIVRQYIEECATAAAIGSIEGESPARTSRRFLEHSDQRFRLSYILGTGVADAGDDEEDADEFVEEESGLTTEDRASLAEKLQSYLNRITSIAGDASNRLEQQLGFSVDSSSQEDRDTFEELLEGHLREEDDFHEVIDDVLEDIESRFNLLAEGELRRGAGDWPETWVVKRPALERRDFLKHVNRFSSNQAPQFGTLLSPVVEGIRVRGPFTPSWNGTKTPRLVLIDGEGLGHAGGATVNISTRVTKRYQDAEAILLVDSAPQPLLAAPSAALRSIVASGQQSKLVLLFTHFDQMRAPNLPTRVAKEQHVVSSLEQAITVLGKELGRGLENSLKKLVPTRSFFASNLHEQIPSPQTNASQRQTVAALVALIDTIDRLALPEIPDVVVPVYDDANLVLAIQRSVIEFREPWQQILQTEHWTRIKALTQRIGVNGKDEYDTLMPVADLIGHLQSQIRPFLTAPVRWEPAVGATDEMMTYAVNQMAQAVFSRLHDFAAHRVTRDRAVKWQEAYAHRGVGSSKERRRDVEVIYGEAAPIPSSVADRLTNEFLRDIRALIRDAIGSAGGKLEGLSGATA